MINIFSNNQYVKKENMFFILFSFLNTLIMILKIPEYILDILILLNYISIFIFILCIVNISELKYKLLYIFIIISFFRLSINISILRLVLFNGNNFKGKIITFLGNFIVRSNNIIISIISLLILIILIIIIIFFYFYLSFHIYKEITRLGNINKTGNIIIEKEYIQNILSIWEDLRIALNFIKSDIIITILSVLLIIIGGTIISLILKNAGFYYIFKNYIIYAIGVLYYNIISLFLITFSFEFIINKYIRI